MARTDIRPATPADAEAIAKFVRPADREELWAVAYRTPLEVMLKGMEVSEAEVGTVDGVPVCMWGIKPESLMGRVGIPWMVGSHALDAYAMRFLRRNHLYIHRAMQTYDKLFNYVDERNVNAVAWLRWLGFRIEDPKPYGALGLPFHKFTMEKKHV